MAFIHLLRIKCEPLEQPDFLARALPSSDIITKALLAKPTADVGRGSEWHVGNVERIPDDGISFAMGRTAMVSTPRFDERTHDFMEEEGTRAPYTFGVFDTRHQSCGIVRKPGVSQNAAQIAAKLQTLLNSTSFPREANVRIVVDPVWDPFSFIEALYEAERVTRFSFFARKPNPHDVESLIQRPAEEFTKVAGGERTRVEVEGEELQKEVIGELAQAVAAVGEEASATIRPSPESRTKRIHLSGNPATEPIEKDEKRGLLPRILEATRHAYDRVRNAQLR